GKRSIKARSVAHQPTGLGPLSRGIDRRDGVARRQRQDLHATLVEQREGTDQERVRPCLCKPLLRKVTPVTLPPGRLRVGTSPALTGSLPIAKTIGIVVVAALAERADMVPRIVTITVTPRRTRSFANAGNRSYCPAAERCSIVTLLPAM